jgi:hypothetical protein
MQTVDLMAHRHWVEKRLAEKGYAIPTEFHMTAPAYSPNSARHRGGHMRNPQTEAFLQLLELPYLLDCKTAPPIPLDSQEYMASLPKVLQTEGTAMIPSHLFASCTSLDSHPVGLLCQS